jgi:hypothetical protein
MNTQFKPEKPKKQLPSKPKPAKPYRQGGKKLIKVLDKSVFDKNFDYGLE